MAQSEIVVETRDLRRSFGALEAVRGVDLDIRRGEVFGFLGPNGAGKSTLLRMLLGLLHASSGEARVLGHELPADAERLRSRLGYMTQRFSLYTELSVRENLEFVAEIYGLGPAARRRRLAEVVERHELGSRLEQRAGTLSGGWRQRLALAAATLHEPEIVVLDEPTAGVDPDRRRAFWHELFALAAAGATVLVSTHYMDEALRCHRLCVLRNGLRVALGSPQELIAGLADRVVEITGENVQEALARIERRPQVAAVTRLGNSSRVLLNRSGGAAALAAVCRRELDQAGLGATRVQADEATLEDVFVAFNLEHPPADEEAP